MTTGLTLGEVQHRAHPVAYARVSVEHLNIHTVFGCFFVILQAFVTVNKVVDVRTSY